MALFDIERRAVNLLPSPKEQGLILASSCWSHQRKKLEAGIIQKGVDGLFPESCWQQHFACKQRRSSKVSVCQSIGDSSFVTLSFMQIMR